MHYKDGTGARVGDLAKFTQESTSGTGDKQQKTTRVYVGVLGALNPSCAGCNGTLRQCLVREDVYGYGSHVYPYAGELTVTVGQLEKVA